VIGRKDGFDDPRGQIIFSLADIIKEKQPNSFLLENVKGLITHDDGRTLKKIISILEKAGYIVIYKVLNSIDYGVPQNRQRVYILGFNKELNKDISEFHWPERIEKPDLNDFLIDDNIVTDERIAILDHYLKNDQNKGKYSVDDLKLLEGKILDTRMNDLRIYDGKCPTLRAQRDGILYVKNNAIHQLTGYEALLLQGFPKEYADKVKDKVTDRHLLMQAGNAMTVTVIKELGKEIIRFLKEE
jgi:DNA (cytosine-5)-methyltransferase 1